MANQFGPDSGWIKEGQVFSQRKRIIKFNLIIVLSILIFFATSSLEATVKTTGAIKGKVLDKQGKPITGAYLSLLSPNLVGVEYYLTKKSGNYHFINLTPGVYKIIVEAPGFVSAIINELRIETGKTLNLDISLEPSEQDQEKILLLPLPELDRESATVSYVLDRDIIHHIPKIRDLKGLLSLTPGLSPDTTYGNLSFSVNGSSARDNSVTFLVNELNRSFDRSINSLLDADLVEEIEVEAAAHPVESYSAPGSFIKIIPAQGSNNGSREIKFFATGGNLVHNLWKPDNQELVDPGSVIKEKYNLDFSANIAGAILPDRVWQFISLRYNQKSKSTPFQPWRDPNNIIYPKYSWKAKDFYSMMRISTQVMPELRASLLISFNRDNQTVDPELISATTPQIATMGINGQSLFLMNLSGSYKFDSETIATGFIFYTGNKKPRFLYPDGKDNPRYVDLGTGYAWGSGQFNDRIKDNIYRVGLSATRWQNFLGLNHELLAGAEYESSTFSYSVWKTDNLIHYYVFGNPYYYSKGFSPNSGNLVGMGLIGFYLASGSEDGLIQRASLHRLIFYGKDNLSIGSRLSLSLGLKFERTQSGLSPVFMASSGNSTSILYGNALIKSIYGINPYSAQRLSGWDNMIIWHTLSPRLGIVLDLFGRGNTLLKGSFNRYAENLSLSYLVNFSPAAPGNYHLFYWYDENGDKKVDIDDTLELFPEDYRIHQNDYFRKRVAPGLKPPFTTEWTIALEHKIKENMTVSLAYIDRTKQNLIEDVLYDPDNDREWYQLEQAPEWWIPFNTVVPGAPDYGNTSLTVYFPSINAPALFTRLNNVKGLKQHYSGWQFVFRKRMSDRWQLLASATLSKATGNGGLSRTTSSCLTALANSPNSFLNISSSSRLDLDRPFIFQIMGTYQLPENFFISARFYGYSGTPWLRTVTIVPPENWLKTHGAMNVPVTVLLEEPGTRRYSFFHSLDVRLEKNFKLTTETNLNIYLDILNILGKKYLINQLDEGGYWYPSAEGTAVGSRVFSPFYQKVLSAYGTRTAQLCFRLRF